MRLEPNDIVTHPKFGRGRVLFVDRRTYPMAIVLYESEMGLLTRPATELTLTERPATQEPRE